MTTFARHKVSKQKRRFKDKKNNFDLDLTYITKRIIAMGFPSEKSEALYRNPLTEVQRFFEFFHQDQYYLYNLCQERDYDPEKFHGRMSRFPFYDHNAPPLNMIQECCNHIDDWLAEDDERVVGINCKAGKGRTGLIICCYLLHCGQCTTSDEALVFYGNRRTKDGKGVTIASQQRYIRYYERVLGQYGGQIPDGIPLRMTRLRITAYPKTKLPDGVPIATIEINDEITHFSPAGTVEKVGKGIYKADIPVQGIVEGDVKIQILLKKKGGGKQALCHFWFNSGFIDDSMVLDHTKAEIDVANKDRKCKVFAENFSIQAFFSEPEEQSGKKSKKPKKGGKSKKESKKPKKDTETPETPKKKGKKEKTDLVESQNTIVEDTKPKKATKPKKDTGTPETPKKNGKKEKIVTPESSSVSPEQSSSSSIESTRDSESMEQLREAIMASAQTSKRKSFYDYSDYGNLQDQIDLSDDSEALSFSSED